MKSSEMFFNVFPRIIKADTQALITITPLYEHRMFKETSIYEIGYCAMEYPLGKGSFHENTKRVYPTEGSIKLKQFFAHEQEHIMILYKRDGDEKIEIERFSFYSVEGDLFSRYPFKGDLHLHSHRSDGTETPGYVAAASRKIGLDFMAITDHRIYTPSIEARESFKGLDLDLEIHLGEEVHPPDTENVIHIVNYGGKFSVNELMRGDNTEKYLSEVNEIIKTLTDIPDDENPYIYASTLWIFNKIREAGGLGIYAHPFYRPFYSHSKQGYNNSSNLNDFIFSNDLADAFEVLGRRPEMTERNALQLAFYNEERAKGKRIPIVASTDAHSTDVAGGFGNHFTIVFSPSAGLCDLKENIKTLYTVAVESFPGQVPRVFGPVRLVKYAQFLIRKVIPFHDSLCFEQGCLMMDHLNGDGEAAAKLKKVKGQTKRLYDLYFGRNREYALAKYAKAHSSGSNYYTNRYTKRRPKIGDCM